MFPAIDWRVALATFVLCVPALAQPTNDVCSQSYVSAQRLQRAGKLMDARAAMLTCADAACPAEIQTDCVQWLAEVRRKLPSVVFAVRDARGRDLSDVRVLVDGRAVAARLDGKAIDLDPGTHAVRFEPRGAPAHDVSVVVREGEQDRAIAFDLPPPPTHRPVPAGFWIGSTIALASFGAFAGFGLWGLGDLDALAYCKGKCAAGDVDAVNVKYAIADIALGVGVIAAVTSFILLVTRPSVPIRETLVGWRF